MTFTADGQEDHIAYWRYGMLFDNKNIIIIIDHIKFT